MAIGYEIRSGPPDTTDLIHQLHADDSTAPEHSSIGHQVTSGARLGDREPSWLRGRHQSVAGL